VYKAFAGFCLGGFAFLLACECLFRLLPVSTTTATGYYIDPDILSYPPHHAWRRASGWDLRNARKLTSNNFGFVADHDFTHNPKAVGLVGDSYVEAAMLQAADRPAAQLERLLDGPPVFALGVPGTSLLDYAERIRFASQHFGVRRFVVLMEAGDVRQSLCGSGQNDGPCLDPHTFAARQVHWAEPSRAKLWMRHSALAQYVFSQLEFDPLRALRQWRSPSDIKGVATRTPAGPALPMVEAVTSAFFERVAPYVQGGLVIVVDGRRAGPPDVPTATELERHRFIELARAAGARVLDAELLYASHAAASRLSLDVGPHDQHLNPLGVKLVMAAAAGALQ